MSHDYDNRKYSSMLKSYPELNKKFQERNHTKMTADWVSGPPVGILFFLVRAWLRPGTTWSKIQEKQEFWRHFRQVLIADYAHASVVQANSYVAITGKCKVGKKCFFLAQKVDFPEVVKPWTLTGIFLTKN